MSEQAQDAGVDDQDVRVPAAEQADVPDPVAALLDDARAVCAERPELLEVLDRLERLDEVELARRPEVLDAAHRLLRETLTDAGRPGPGS